MWIKVILILGILAVALMMLKTGSSDRNTAIRRLGMTAFAVLSVVLVIYPSIVTRIANLVGVQRGADLVFYLLVLAFLASLLTAAQRASAQERRITKLARFAALQNVHYPPGKSATVSTPAATPAAPATAAAPAQPAGGPTTPTPAGDHA